MKADTYDFPEPGVTENREDLRSEVIWLAVRLQTHCEGEWWGLSYYLRTEQWGDAEDLILMKIHSLTHLARMTQHAMDLLEHPSWKTYNFGMETMMRAKLED